MKKILHFTLALLMTSLLQAQTFKKSKRHSYLTGTHEFFKKTNARVDKSELTNALKLVERKDYSKNLTTNKYSDDLKYNYEYDAKGNVINELETYFDGIKWVNYHKTETNYNVNNQAINQIFYDWNDTGWVYAVKEDYIYDDKNRINTYINSYWDGSMWINDVKEEYYYNANNVIFQTVFTHFDGITVFESKYDDGRDSLIFDQNQRIIEKLHFSHNKLVSKSEYKYDNINLTLIKTVLEYDNFYKKWVNDWKDSTGFDENGNVIYNYSYYSAFSSNNLLELSYSDKYTYDLNTSISTIYWPFNQYQIFLREDMMNTAYKNKLKNIYAENYNKGEVTYVDSITYNYSTFTAIIDYDNSNNQIKVLNNPNDNSISFLLTDPSNEFTLNVYDVNGKLILNQMIQNQEVISLSSFKKGLYIFKVNNEKQSYTGKLLVE